MSKPIILRHGSRGPLVKKLQDGLKELKIKGVGRSDGHYGDKTEAAVERLQRRWNKGVGGRSTRALYVDGVAGPATLGAYNTLLRNGGHPAEHIIELGNPKQREPVAASERLGWVRVETDVHAGGYKSTTLRADAAERFKRIVETAHELGGIVSSAGGRRRLASRAGANRSRKSLHYPGIAHDLATRSGMQGPSDPFIVENIGDRRWRLWSRSNTLSFPDLREACEDLGIEARTDVVGTFLARESRGKTALRTETVTGAFFDFSALAKEHGWHGIRARRSFLRGGGFGGSEWWHLQDQTTLVEGVTTFGDELLKVYTLKQAEKFVYWNEAKGATWGVDWG